MRLNVSRKAAKIAKKNSKVFKFKRNCLACFVSWLEAKTLTQSREEREERPQKRKDGFLSRAMLSV